MKLHMRVVFAAIVALSCLLGTVSAPLAGSYQGNGAYSGTPSPLVTQLFASFPNGGDGLVAAIRDLIIGNSALADDVAYVASRGNLDQQSAAGAGLAQALTALVNRGDNGGAARIVNASTQSGSAAIQTAVGTAVASSASFSNYQSSNSSTSTNCTARVSPANSCQ
jgi:hypothetical protein